MTTWDNVEKSGTGWAYNEPNLVYDQVTDPDSGDAVSYNGIGTATVWTNLNKP